MLARRLSERWETVRLVELIRRAARNVREDAVLKHTDEERHFLSLQADDLEALAKLYVGGAVDIDRMMARAVELALLQLDEQIAAGIPKQNQHVDYALIYRQVRAELGAAA